MSIEDPIFTELALKVIAKKATESEKAKLTVLLAEPQLAAEFKQLQKDVAFAKEALPLMGEESATTPVLTEFERSQLEQLVKSRANKKDSKQPKSAWSWQWLVGLAGAAAGIAILIAVNWPASTRTVASTEPKPGTNNLIANVNQTNSNLVISKFEFAMLDSIGQMRGNNNGVNSNLVTTLQENFGQTNFTTYSGSAQLNEWLNQPSSGVNAKVVYDRDGNEVRVVYRGKDKQLVTKTFPVSKEEDLPAVLKQAHDAIKTN